MNVLLLLCATTVATGTYRPSHRCAVAHCVLVLVLWFPSPLREHDITQALSRERDALQAAQQFVEHHGDSLTVQQARRAGTEIGGIMNNLGTVL